MLTILLIMQLLGGGESAFINENLIKHAKAHVEDAGRKAEIIEITKAHKKWAKANSKEFGKVTKNLANLNANAEAKAEEFSAFFQQVLELKNERQSRQISARLAIAERVTPEEWVQVLTAIDGDAPKTRKAFQKTLIKLNVSFEKFSDKVAKIISDEARATTAIVAIDQYGVALKDMTAAISHFNYQDAPILRHLSESEENLRMAVGEINTRRATAQKAFQQLHFDLLACTTDTEWPKVAKAMNKL